MKKTPIFTALFTALAMGAMILLREQLNFTTYLVLVLAPVLLSALVVHKAKGVGALPIVLVNTLVYTVLFAAGSVVFGNLGGYETIAANSFQALPEGIAVGEVSGFQIGELLLPTLSAFVLFFQIGRASCRERV